MRNLEKLLVGEPRIVCEYKLTRMWSPPGDDNHREVEVPAWILAVCFSIFEDEKRLVNVYVIDISYQKWAESIQSQHATAAELAKRQQEKFIDTVSHEMRNPLTAIMQLASSIATSTDTLNGTDASLEEYKLTASDSAEAASTILTCTAYMKRVVDDVLTLSRMESDMLSITLAPKQLTSLLAKIVKMFDG